VAQTNREQGTTIILTTHDMDDVERLCHRVIIIDHGRLLYQGDLESLKRRYAPHRELIVRPAAPTDLDQITSPAAESVRIVDDAVVLRFDPAVVAAPELTNDVSSRFALVDLSVVEPDVEDVIRRLYLDRPELAGTADHG
ncbi:MAG: methionine ABC transporter ATP-binding protein, partial [Microlunatus sp.]|nr:methionine ABC transporter ATP-binding protein [Microlunatus sp.]